MSKTINDGGAAFPVAMSDQSHSNQDCAPFQGGMSLRDHFAGLAMQARMSDYESCASMLISSAKNGVTFAQEVAYQAYDMADAMIAARAGDEA